MTLNISGSLSLGGSTIGQSIEEEFYGTASNPLDIKTAAARAGVANAVTNITFNQFHGVSAILSISPGSETIPYAVTYANYNPILTFTTSSKTTAYPPYTYVISAGSLPAGMTLSSAGVLSGKPTVSGTFTFNITSTDSKTPTAQSCVAVYTLNVTAVAQFTSNIANTFYLGYTYGSTTSTQFSANQTSNSTSITPITVNGGTTPYTFSSTTSTVFPSLLTLNSSTGAITITGGSTAITNFSTAKTLNLSFTDSTTSPYTYTATTSAITVQSVQYITATANNIVLLYATPSSTTSNYPANTFNAGGTTTIAAATGVNSFTGVSGGLGGTYTYAITPALPAGLSYNTANGLVTSTNAVTVSPLTTPQTYTVTITNPTTTFRYTSSFTLQAVSQLNVTLTTVMYVMYTRGATTTTLFSKNQQTTFTSFTPVAVTGGTTPYSFVHTNNLPVGISLDPVTGSVTMTTGSVLVSTFYTSGQGFTINVTDSTNPGALTYNGTTVILYGAQAITATQVPILLVYSSGSTSVSTFYAGGVSTIPGATGVAAFSSVSGGLNGGTGSFLYSVTGLPSGLALSTTGILTSTGTLVSGLTTKQTYNAVINETGTGFTYPTTISIQAVQQFTVSAPVIQIYVTYVYGSTLLTGFSTNQTSINSTFTPLLVTGGTTPYTFGLTGITLSSPSTYFTLNSATGVLSINSGAVNTGLTGGSYSYTVTVTDSTSVTNMTYTTSQLLIRAVQLLTATTTNVVIIYTPPATTSTTFSGGGTTIIAGTTGIPVITNVTGGVSNSPTFSISPTLPSQMTLNPNSPTVGAATLTIQLATAVSTFATAQTYNVTITDPGTTFSYVASFTIKAVAQLAVTTQPIYLLYTYGATTSTTFINSQTTANPIASTTYGTSPYTYSSSNLPSGLVLNSSTGAVTINGGSVAISGFTSQQTFAIVVTDSTTPNALTVTSSSLHVQAVQAIRATPVAIVMTYTGVTTTTFLNGTNAFTGVSGGLGTLSYTVSSGTPLPTGLALSATGVLSSTGVTVSGLLSPQTYNVTITDPTTGITLSTSFSVQAVGLLTATVNTPSSNIYLVYQYGATTATSFAPNQTSTITPVTVTGGGGALVYTLLSALTSNISINSSTGALSITTPITVAGYTTQTYTITAHDSASTQQTYSSPTWNFTNVVQAIHVTPVYIVMYYTGTTTSTFAGSGGTQILGTTGVNPFTSVTGGLGTLGYVATGLPTGLSLSSAGLLTSTGVTSSSITTQQTYNTTITDPTTGISLATSFNLIAVSQLQVTPKNIYITYASGATTATTFMNSATSAYPFTVTGGSGTLVYSSTTLPSAFTLNTSTGAITINGGSVAIAPYTSGVTFTLTVTDQTQSPYTQTYTNSTITIQAVQVLAVTNNTTTFNLANGVPITNLAGAVPTYTGGLTPITYSSTALSAVFTGLTFSAGSGGTATLSGTPNTESTWTAKTSTQTGYYTSTNFSFTVTDIVGQTATGTTPMFISVRPGQSLTVGGSGTWTPPTAVTVISAVAVGGGGGGGGAAFARAPACNYLDAGGGGAGGGGGALTYVTSYSIPTTVTSFTVVGGAVGVGGTLLQAYKVTKTGVPGTAGGQSSLTTNTSTTIIYANGGNGGGVARLASGATSRILAAGCSCGGSGAGGGGSNYTRFNYGGTGGNVKSVCMTSLFTNNGMYSYGSGGGGGAGGWCGYGGNGGNAGYLASGTAVTPQISPTAGSGTSGIAPGGGGGGGSYGTVNPYQGNYCSPGGSGGGIGLFPTNTSITVTGGTVGSTPNSTTRRSGAGGNGLSSGSNSYYGGGGGGGNPGGNGGYGAVKIIWGTQSAATSANGTLIPPSNPYTRQYPFTNVQDY